MAFSAKEIRAVQQRRAIALATSENEIHDNLLPIEDRSSNVFYLLGWVSIGALVVMTLCVSYYYVIFLPKHQEMLLQLKTQELKDAVDARLVAEITAKQKEEAARQEAAINEARRKAQLETCLSNTTKIYESLWTEHCKEQARKDSIRLQECELLYFPEVRAACRKDIGDIDDGPNCTLRSGDGRSLNAVYKDKREECFKRYPG